MSAPLGAVLSAAGIALCLASGWGFAQGALSARGTPSAVAVTLSSDVAVQTTPTAASEATPQVVPALPMPHEEPVERVAADLSSPLRLPLMPARVTLDAEAEQALAALDAFVPVQGGAPTHLIEVSFGIERADVPRELAERRFNEMVRVLRQRGFWRPQIRDRGWHSNEDAFVTLRAIPWSDG